MEDNKQNIFTDGNATKDNAIPLKELLSQMKDDTQNDQNDAVVKQPAPQPKEEVSPLEKLKMEKENGSQYGQVISNDELEKGSSDVPKKNIIYNDDRMSSIEESINDMDSTIKKRSYVVLTTQPKDQFEYISMMEEIDSLKIDENGKAKFSLVDDEGNPVEPKYCRLRNEGEESFDFSNIPNFKEKEDEPSDDGKQEENSTKDDDAKKKIVQVIIDKTGLGTDFMFDDEERKKIEEAETIRVNEVKTIDIKAINTRRSQKSFQDVVNQFSTTGSKTTICFPASGFRAQMKGLTYGEYADTALDMEKITFDQYYKRLSIIYNKMTNISTGPFDDFEDFLKHFSYTDIAMAVYGMFISTEAEKQEISLRCGSNTCRKSFNWNYYSRNVLRLNRCADTVLNKMEEIASASAIDFDSIQQKAAVNNSKFIELPESKLIVELGVASAYDFLYNFIPLMEEDTFKDAFGNDFNDVYLNNVILLTTVRSVRIPTEDGYVEGFGYKDILDSLYNVSPNEIKLLLGYMQKIQSEYEITFAFSDVICPHCKNVTESLDISIDDLVFQTYQRLMSTEIDLEKYQDL